MAELYDSDRVRDAARGIGKVAEALSEGTTDSQKKALQLCELLEGKASEALQERLQAFRSRTETLSRELWDLAREMEGYAAALEKVSAELENSMQ